MSKRYFITEATSFGYMNYEFKDKPRRWYKYGVVDVSDERVTGFATFEMVHSVKAAFRHLRKSNIEYGAEFLIEKVDDNGFVVARYNWIKRKRLKSEHGE